jgi:hypothetical protein
MQHAMQRVYSVRGQRVKTRNPLIYISNFTCLANKNKSDQGGGEWADEVHLCWRSDIERHRALFGVDREVFSLR